MALARRKFLAIASAAALDSAWSRRCLAQNYPTRAVRLIVGQTAGGAQDVVARLITHWLSNRMGQPFVVENKPGAGTNIAAEAVVRSPPDGYSLLLVGAPNAINATLYDRLNFNFLHDIAPIAAFVRSPEVLLVHPSLPANNLKEFIAYARTNPGAVMISSPGIGSGPHLSAELLKTLAAIDLTHVPYRGGGQAIADLIGGQVQANFTAPVVAMEHIKTGAVRPLAVTTRKRSHLLPEIPSIAETLPGYESGGFFGLGAPSGIPRPVVDRLNAEINAALADPEMGARIVAMGAFATPGSPQDFSDLIIAETSKWAKVIIAAGIKAS